MTKILKKGFGQLNLLATAAVIFVVAGIVISFGSMVTNEIALDFNSTGNANVSVGYAAANNATEGIGKLAKYLPLLGLVVAAAIIISVVVGSFKMR